MSKPAEMIPLMCACGDCDPPLPWGYICNGVLVVYSRHHGRKHVNSIPVDKLAEMCYNVREEKPE